MATFGKYKYTDVIFEIKGKIGIIKVRLSSMPGILQPSTVSDYGTQLNRPKSLNAFGGNLLMDVVTALRELNEHPDTVFTVITGEGRFFSSGADVKGKSAVSYFLNAAYRENELSPWVLLLSLKTGL